MIDEPQGVRVGGVVAAPVFARVAAAQLARHDILTEPEIEPPAPAPAPRPPLPAPQLRAEAAPPAAVAAASVAAARPAAGGAAHRGALRVEQLGDRLLVPDFSGLSPGEIRRATAGTGLRVEFDGDGTAVGQHPAPGTILGSGAGVVRVRFRPSPGAAPAGRGL
jgi:hypothetical protein